MVRYKLAETENIKSFMGLVEWMYGVFPNGRAGQDLVHSIIVTEADREMLINHGYLFREPYNVKGKKQWQYNLGPNSLNLFSAWKTERLTQRMKRLTSRTKLISYKIGNLTKALLILTTALILFEVGKWFIATL